MSRYSDDSFNYRLIIITKVMEILYSAYNKVNENSLSKNLASLHIRSKTKARTESEKDYRVVLKSIIVLQLLVIQSRNLDIVDSIKSMNAYHDDILYKINTNYAKQAPEMEFKLVQLIKKKSLDLLELLDDPKLLEEERQQWVDADHDIFAVLGNDVVSPNHAHPNTINTDQAELPTLKNSRQQDHRNHRGRVAEESEVDQRIKNKITSYGQERKRSNSGVLSSSLNHSTSSIGDGLRKMSFKSFSRTSSANSFNSDDGEIKTRSSRGKSFSSLSTKIFTKEKKSQLYDDDNDDDDDDDYGTGYIKKAAPPPLPPSSRKFRSKSIDDEVKTKTIPINFSVPQNLSSSSLTNATDITQLKNNTLIKNNNPFLSPLAEPFSNPGSPGISSVQSFQRPSSPKAAFLPATNSTNPFLSPEITGKWN